MHSVPRFSAASRPRWLLSFGAFAFALAAGASFAHASDPQYTCTEGVPIWAEGTQPPANASETVVNGKKHIEFADGDDINPCKVKPDGEYVEARGKTPFLCNGKHEPGTERGYKADANGNAILDRDGKIQWLVSDDEWMACMLKEAGFSDRELYGPCDIRRFRDAEGKTDLDSWKDCLDGKKKKARADEIAKMVMDDAHDRLAQCPQNFSDIQALEAIVSKESDFSRAVDVSALVVSPLNPTSARFEAHLPLLCGYDSQSQRWMPKRNLYCMDQKTCYSQSNDMGSGKDEVLSKPMPGQPNRWKAVKVKTGTPSYHEGGNKGDMTLIPLGKDGEKRGLFVQAYFTSAGLIYTGLVVAPTAESFLARACEKETWLAAKQGALQLDAIEVARVQDLIAELMGKGVRLDKVREITRRLQNSVLSPSVRASLDREAGALLSEIDRGASNRSEFIGQSACAALAERRKAK